MLISHDLSVLADVCQRAAVMYAGQLVEVGPAATVFDQGAHPYSAALAGAFPRIGDARFRYAPSGLPGVCAVQLSHQRSAASGLMGRLTGVVAMPACSGPG